MNVLEIAISVIAPYMYLVLLGSLFVYLFQKKYNFQTILPIALMSVTLFVFAFTIVFHNITIAFFLTVIATLCVSAFLFLDKQMVRTLRENIITPGFVIFSLIYFVIIFLNWSKPIPTLSDSSLHWAPHVFTMWLRNDFYTSPGLSIVNHGDYPPIIQLFELLWSKAANVYREGLLLAAIQTLGLVMVLPAFRQLSWRGLRLHKIWFIIFVSSVIILAMPLVMSVSNFYSFLDVDTTLAFIFAYGMYVAYINSKKFTLAGLFQISIIVSFILLAKQIAILFALLVMLVYVAGLILSYRSVLLTNIASIGIRKLKKYWKTYLTVVIALILPLFCKFAWSLQARGYVSPSEGVAIFHLNPLDALQIPPIFAYESGSAAQQLFSHAYFKHVLFDSGGLLLNNLIEVSYMQIGLLFVGAIFIMWLTKRRDNGRGRLAVLGVILAIGWLLYVAAIYTVFLFGGMKDVELNNLELTNRYLGTYLFAMLVVVVMLLLTEFIELTVVQKKSRPLVYLAIALVVVFGVLFNRSVVDALGLRAASNSQSVMNSYNIPRTEQSLRDIAKLSGGTFTNRYVVAVTAEAEVENHYLQYVGMPNRVLTVPDEDGGVDKLCRALQKSDYLVVSYLFQTVVSQQLDQSCLANNVELKLNAAYKITKTDNRVTLKEIHPAQ